MIAHPVCKIILSNLAFQEIYNEFIKVEMD